jgi:hypothetical protein
MKQEEKAAGGLAEGACGAALDAWSVFGRRRRGGYSLSNHIKTPRPTNPTAATLRMASSGT